MTLSEFRNFFVKMTGRYDLVKQDGEDYADAGANTLINMGVRMLDSMFTHNKSYGKVPVKLKPNQALYMARSMLSIEGIQFSADSGKVTLDHIQEQEIEEKLSLDGSNSGCPKYYAIASVVRDAFLDNEQSAFKRLHFKICPAPDQSYAAQVYGRMTIPLENDNDTNFWTLNYPETLTSATMYQIERFHRNSQGMRDHMVAIQQDLRNLDYNAIESQMGSNTQMNDSWNFRAEGNEW